MVLVFCIQVAVLHLWRVWAWVQMSWILFTSFYPLSHGFGGSLESSPYTIQGLYCYDRVHDTPPVVGVMYSNATWFRWLQVAPWGGPSPFAVHSEIAPCFPVVNKEDILGIWSALFVPVRKVIPSPWGGRKKGGVAFSGVWIVKLFWKILLPGGCWKIIKTIQDRKIYDNIASTSARKTEVSVQNPCTLEQRCTRRKRR